MKKTGFIIILMVIIFSCTGKKSKQAVDTELNIIPLPLKVEVKEGSLDLTGRIAVAAVGNGEAARLAEMLADYLEKDTGLEVNTVNSGAVRDGAIYLVLGQGGGDGKESYTLEVTPDRIVLRSGTGEGLFRGIQTLRQVVLSSNLSAINNNKKRVRIPLVSIEDSPSFQWRGMNLDCSRHFITKDFVKRYIDLLAFYRMNVLHWNLTNDQGWRVEIQKYPRLTEVGAWRTEKDGSRHGGFYTRDEIREVVRYAADRYITVVPEIDMPGHCQAAIAAYPELSCTGEEVSVSNRWGFHRHVYCPGSEKSFAFLYDVIDEVAEIFPGKYIHLGGDECVKLNWKSCPRCQSRIREEGLKNEAQLQSYFIRRVVQYIQKKNKEAIGWDEVLHGGLAPGVIVQSWQGFDGAVTAVKQGHKTIVSPTEFTYFDYPLSATDLRKVYDFKPVPAGITDNNRSLVLGSEANMWTEWASQDDIDNRMLPRLLALSEVLWSPENSRKWDDFHGRVRAHYPVLDRMGVDYGGESEWGIMGVWYFLTRTIPAFIDIWRDDPGMAQMHLDMFLGKDPFTVSE